MPQLNGKVQIVSRGELQEAEHVNEAIDGAFWRAIERKVQAMIEQSQGVLLESDQERDIARAQGAVRALRRVLELPAILRKEARTKS